VGYQFNPFTGNLDLAGSAAAASPAYVKYTFTYVDFNALGAVLNGTLPIVTVPAGYSVEGLYAQHTVAFAGSGLGYASITIANGVGSYFGKDVFSAANTQVYTTTTSLGPIDSAASSNITITMDADINLDTFTAGSVDIFILLMPLE